MALIDLPGRAIHLKLVYYGPERSGKTTNLRQIARVVPTADPARFRAIASPDERTIFADALPLDLGRVGGFHVTAELASVAIVLHGADGVVFVADASAPRLDENRRSLEELLAFAEVQGKRFPDFPLVLQYNKTDLPDALAPFELDRALNPLDLPRVAAVAVDGAGVVETLREACRRTARAL
jgi:signal recognition particle receptor subunit beta